jgi:hypothetical protein
MRLFRKKTLPDMDATTPDERAAALAALVGTAPCNERDCAETTGMPCEYVDRRERHCRTAWCPTHRMIVDDHIFCRRHAGVVSALPSDALQTIALPDIDNRAPSLVGWMARQIDADVWRLMLRELDASSGGQLIADPVTLVFLGVERQRAWERAWKLVSHEGDQRRVSLVVQENKDEELIVKVGPNVVDRVVPPWIVHRQRGELIAADQDALERGELNQRVIDAVQMGLERERTLSEAVSRTAGTPFLRVSDRMETT